MVAKFLIVLGLLALLLMPGNLCAEQTALKVGTSIKPPYSTRDEDGFLDRLLKELFIRVGTPFTIVRQPAARALMSANQGLVDMELPRIIGIEKQYPNLVMIPEPVVEYAFVAFAREGCPTRIDWNTFNHLPVGLLRGWKIYERILLPETMHRYANKPEQLLRMLVHKRVDVALYERNAGRFLLRKNNIHAHEMKPPYKMVPMYIYIHEAHRDMLPLLTKTLREIKADGTYARLAAETLNAP